jgi:hypothetical protein
MWKYLKFEPWSDHNLQGVCRKITFVKGGFIGTVAEYYVMDYIIWEHCGFSDIEKIYNTCKPITDVMTQRFLFVGNVAGAPLVKTKSFLLGLRGYLEVFSYVPGGEFHSKIKDVIPFVDFALKHAENLTVSEII